MSDRNNNHTERKGEDDIQFAREAPEEDLDLELLPLEKLPL